MLRAVEEKLNWGEKTLHQLSQDKEKLRNIHLNRCHEMVNFKFELTSLKAIMRTKMEEDATSNPMAEKSKEESHNLYLASLY
ncbi:hypothetical protein H5410_041148 [Solanum commersonii]|uniref:Uncharacterized protein n=1 Tax=Solanum commersonii TaxID=4109 RepID=A0A9J5XS74_SOLCO|nr:hypothetical protein H5410_041148 [Solanum commersonii]